MADLIELEARISAMELVLVTHLLQSGIASPGFDPRSFASSRRDAWTAIGNATCSGCASDDEERAFAEAYAAALERLGHLLVILAEPVQEAIDEVGEERGEPMAKPSDMEEAAKRSGVSD